MPKVRDVLTKIYDLCKARAFIFERSLNLCNNDSKILDYGPLGIEIRRNLLSEWWHEIVTSRENISGVELAFPDQLDETTEEFGDRGKPCKQLRNYLVDTSRYVRKLAEIYGTQGPAGIAQIVNVLQDCNVDIDQFMFRSRRKELYVLCFFCPQNKVNYWMDYWMRKRLSWWKKYADIPSEFSLVDRDFRQQFFQHDEHASSDTMAVQFNFPWGEEAVECISSYSNTRELIKTDEFPDEFLGVIIATLSVERGLLAYLLDGYQESEYLDPNGIKKTHSKLRLHPALAPVKVAVLSKNDASSDLGRVARQLATELREAGITTHFADVDNSCDDIDEYTLRQDEIGTPYTVTLLDSTLTNGVVKLRNRDTTLSEFLHISEILKTIQRHLDDS